MLTRRINECCLTAMEKMKELICYTTSTASQCIRFINIEQSSLKTFLFIDVSFGNSEGLASQLVFLVTIGDQNGNKIILSYESKKSGRGTKGFMAAELLALVHGYDQAYIAKHMLEVMLQMMIPISAYINVRTVFNSVAKHTFMSDKRLAIHISALQGSLRCRELNSIGWTGSEDNVADSFTRLEIPKPGTALLRLIDTSKLSIQINGLAKQIREGKDAFH
ncbi:hypothetical protein BWQ96_05908 [Gracilariopsis chorda]|uniref:Uncharacterized protein n=1 Tax=Gracilariopsis chorda TaxID=448386 RepID=A0A2V3IQK0_9FLOR|nr:hypothetical protein BWQ96_05908 [Gracilariopsis chorda]|eukprot:PXF44344.1 hypothetical protein BWQ96_05908 [Gracilariopsis chorda]